MIELLPFVTKAPAGRRVQQLRYSKPIKRDESHIKSDMKSQWRHLSNLVARNPEEDGGVVDQKRKVLVLVVQENPVVLEVQANRAEEEGEVGGEENVLLLNDNTPMQYTVIVHGCKNDYSRMNCFVYLYIYLLKT